MTPGHLYESALHTAHCTLHTLQVELTWDETDPARGKAMKRAFEAAEDEMEEVARGLIASASEDEEQVIVFLIRVSSS